MQNIEKLSVRDIITITILSIIMIIITFAISALTAANLLVTMVFSAGLSCFINAPIFMLMSARVGKRGTFFLYMVILSIVFLLTGYWFVSIYLLLIGLLAELFMRSGNSYLNPKKTATLWTLYSAFYAGTSMLPIFFVWDTYVKAAEAGGFSMEYIETYYYYYTNPAWIITIFSLTMLCGFLGSVLGGRLLDKHFKKAGII